MYQSLGTYATDTSLQDTPKDHHIHRISPKYPSKPSPECIESLLMVPLGSQNLVFDLVYLPLYNDLLTTRDPIFFIKCVLGPCSIKRVMVYYSSSVNMISYDTLLNMHYTHDDIQITKSTCKAFYSHETIPVGQIKIPITIGLVTLITPCLVIDRPTDFNILLGCFWLHYIHTIPSTLYYYVKLLHERQVYVIPDDPDPLSHCLARSSATKIDDCSLIPSLTPPNTQHAQSTTVSTPMSSI